MRKLIACTLLPLALAACLYGPGAQTDPDKIAAAEQWLTASEVALGMASTAVCIFCPALCPAAEATRGLLKVAIETYRELPTEETWQKARQLVSELRQTTDGCESAQVTGL